MSAARGARSGLPPSIKKNATKLRALATSHPEVQKAMLVTATRSLVDALVQLVGNVLSGVVRLTQSQHTKLRRHANTMRTLVHRLNGFEARRNFLKRKVTQSGGFLGMLLRPLMSLVGGALGGLTDRR